MHRKIPLWILMQLKCGSQNPMLGKYRIRFTDKKYFALDLPIKNINALETTMGEGRRRGGDRRVYRKIQCVFTFLSQNPMHLKFELKLGGVLAHSIEMNCRRLKYRYVLREGEAKIVHRPPYSCNPPCRNKAKNRGSRQNCKWCFLDIINYYPL